MSTLTWSPVIPQSVSISINQSCLCKLLLDELDTWKLVSEILSGWPNRICATSSGNSIKDTWQIWICWNHLHITYNDLQWFGSLPQSQLTSAPELWLSRKPLPAPCHIGITFRFAKQSICPQEVWKKYYRPSLKHCFEIFTSWHEDVAVEEKAATITSHSHIWEALWAILLATYVRILHLFFWENGVLACLLCLKMPVLRKATSWLHQLPWTQYNWITETGRQIRQ